MFNSKKLYQLDLKIEYLTSIVAELHKELDELKAVVGTKRDKVKPGEAGPTMGVYNHIDEVNPRVAKKPKGRVVTPKSPAQIEFENQEKIKRLDEPVRTVPR